LKIGDKVEVGDTLIYMLYNEPHRADEAEKIVLAAYNI
jgi:hypothetical protein